MMLILIRYAVSAILTDVSLFDRKGFTVIQIVLLSEMFFTSTLLQHSLFDFFSS